MTTRNCALQAHAPLVADVVDTEVDDRAREIGTSCFAVRAATSGNTRAGVVVVGGVTTPSLRRRVARTRKREKLVAEESWHACCSAQTRLELQRRSIRRKTKSTFSPRHGFDADEKTTATAGEQKTRMFDLRMFRSGRLECE